MSEGGGGGPVGPRPDGHGSGRGHGNGQEAGEGGEDGGYGQRPEMRQWPQSAQQAATLPGTSVCGQPRAPATAHLQQQRRPHHLQHQQQDEQNNAPSLQGDKNNAEEAVNQRLGEFVEYFVKEFEDKLQAYHMILEGEVKNTGPFSDKFAKLIRNGTGGVIGRGIGFLLAGPAAEGLKIASEIGGAIVDKFGERQYRKKVISLAKLVYPCMRNKADLRRLLVEAAFDIFQSFEMQFMRVTIDQGHEGAMRKLAKDATNRAINYLKHNVDASIIEGIILGESKIESVVGIPIPNSNIKTPGYEINYEYKSSNKKWRTASLYEKVGIVIEGKTSQESSIYYEKRDSKSRTNKYGYRRPLTSGLDGWERLKEEYKKIGNTLESSQFTDYQYILDPTNLEEKAKSITEKINLDDKELVEERIKKILGEVKDEIIEEIIEGINTIKTLSDEFEKDCQILANIVTNLKGLNLDEYFKTFVQTMEAANQKIVKSIEQGNEENRIGFQHVHAKLDSLDVLIKQEIKDKPPIWFDIRESVRSFTALSPGRQDTLNKVDIDLQDGVVVISGLDGIGKSELAIKYARDHSNDYEGNGIWINAESEQTLKELFQRLAKEKLNIRIRDNDGEEKGIESIIANVYEYFAAKKSLFIFDNAEKYDNVKTFLPLRLSPDANKPYVLITSPNNLEWGNIKVLQSLGDFTDVEATEFVKKVLEINNDSQDECITKLIKTLHNFPLGLQQAVAYIKYTNEAYQRRNLEFKVSDYLEKYEETPKRLLKVKVPTGMRAKTIFKTLEVTLDRIKNEDFGQQALNMLNIISYFAPSNIPENMFLSELARDDRDELISITSLLEKYSIVRLEQGMLSVHGLVQQVRRLELVEQNEEGKVLEEETLETALRLLKALMKDRNSAEEYTYLITSPWEYAKTYDKLIETFIVNDINETAKYTTYFHLIAEGSRYEVVKAIVNKVEENHCDKLQNIINAKTEDRGAPLHNAALRSDERIVKLLLEKGASVNVKKKHSWTPLHLAAKNGNLSVVKVLLDNGANVDDKTGYKYTSLHLAARNGYSEVAKLLLATADVNAQDNRKYTPLHFAAKNNNFEVVQVLLEDDEINVNAENEYKLTPLHFAAQEGCINIVNVLLEKGANVNVKDKGDFTPLHLAALHNHIEVVNDLLKKSEININPKTTKGNTPLHFAAEKGNLDVVKVLIAWKVDVGIKNEDGKVATDLATEEVKNVIIHN